MRLVTLCLSVTTLLGCAAPPPRGEADWVIKEYNLPITCTGQDECARLWRAAQVWVADNAGYKIQTSSDAVIETFGGAEPYGSRWAMQVTRVPIDRNVDRIVLRPRWGQVSLCRPSAMEMVARFHAALRLTQTLK